MSRDKENYSSCWVMTQELDKINELEISKEIKDSEIVLTFTFAKTTMNH